jgi:thiol-disulfide isomerase/thioredoxin
MVRCFFSALVAVCLPLLAVAAAPAPVGVRVADFTLTDVTTGKPWSLADNTRDAKATVVLFTSTGCPVSNSHAPKLITWHKQYAKKGVVFVAVNSHNADELEAVAKHTKEYGLQFPVLKDDGTKTADKLQVERIPTVLVLDSGRTVRYFGRIDDQFSQGVHKEKATTQELTDALNAVLAGKEVKTAYEAAVGCKLTRETVAVAGAAERAKVTYHQHVSRIVQSKCQECHRDGEAAPFQLMTYKQMKGWAGMIREVVADDVMPPWHADSARGHFANDRRLSPEDKTTLLAWVDQNCPEGDAKDAPEPRKFTTGWRLGREPDEVIRMKKPVKVPAQFAFGLSGMPYQYILAGEPFPETKWVQAVEARPDLRSAIHHIIVHIVPPGKKLEDLDGEILGDGTLVSFVPGDQPTIHPKGTARKVEKGSQLLFEVHYTPNGKAGVDQSSVGLIYAKEKPTHEIRSTTAVNFMFKIPPGEDNHEVKATKEFPEAVILNSFSPHMHLRGKAFRYELISKDGKRELLLSVPKYDFNWQSAYTLAKPREIPAGSVIECTAWFDNSKKNPFNPNPAKAVEWGDQTWEEMMLGYIEYWAK